MKRLIGRDVKLVEINPNKDEPSAAVEDASNPITVVGKLSKELIKLQDEYVVNKKVVHFCCI